MEGLVHLFLLVAVVDLNVLMFLLLRRQRLISSLPLVFQLCSGLLFRLLHFTLKSPYLMPQSLDVIFDKLAGACICLVKSFRVELRYLVG